MSGARLGRCWVDVRPKAGDRSAPSLAKKWRKVKSKKAGLYGSLPFDAVPPLAWTAVLRPPFKVANNSFAFSSKQSKLDVSPACATVGTYSAGWLRNSAKLIPYISAGLVLAMKKEWKSYLTRNQKCALISRAPPHPNLITSSQHSRAIISTHWRDKRTPIGFSRSRKCRQFTILIKQKLTRKLSKCNQTYYLTPSFSTESDF